MVCMTGVMLAIGYTLSGWINFACYYAGVNNPNSSFAWRFPIAFQITSAVIMLIGSPILPYSPRWLIQKGRKSEALAVLRRLHKRADEVHDEYARREFIQMVKQVEYDSKLKADNGRFHIFKTRPNLHRALVSIIVMWGAQFTGVFVLATYLVTIFGTLGLSPSKSLLVYACWVTITIPGNIFTAMFVDRFGRVSLMRIGTGALTLVLICECILQSRYSATGDPALGKASIFFLFFFIFPWWCGCLDATVYVYLSEVWPSHLRSDGQAIGMMAYSLSMIIVLVASPIALNNIGWRLYIVFITCTFTFHLCLWFLFPETRQKSIEDLNETFGDKTVLHFAGATEEELREYAKEIEMEIQQEEGVGAPNLNEGAAKETTEVH